MFASGLKTTHLFVCLSVMFLWLGGCSAQVQKPQDYPVDEASLPQASTKTNSQDGNSRQVQQPEESRRRGSLTLASLQQGNHHPAIAALFKQAEMARQKRQWRKALKYLDQARQIQPRNAAVLYRQAWVNMQLAQPQKAEQLLLRAKAFSGRDKNLMRRLDWLLADSLNAQGKTQKAQAARQRATR